MVSMVVMTWKRTFLEVVSMLVYLVDSGLFIVPFYCAAKELNGTVLFLAGKD